MPYIYGIPQILASSSVLLGRVTSVFFSLVAFGIWLYIARKKSGTIGLSVTALLLATFTYGIYYNSMVKTYALVTLFFALTYLALSSDMKRDWVFLTAAASSLSAVMTRLSALPFTVVIVIYLLVTTPGKKVKLAIGILCVSVLIGFLLLVSQDIPAARWSLITHHIGQWGSRPDSAKLHKILYGRAPDLLLSFLPYLVLFFLSLLLSQRRRENHGVFQQRDKVFVIGVTLFGISHFANGGWALDYFVPGIFSLLPVVGMTFAHAYSRQKPNLKWNMILRVFLFSFLISEAIRGGWQFFDLSGGRTPMAEVQDISRYIRSQTVATDRIIVFEGLALAIDSNRQVMPGMTMAQFSMVTGEADETKQLNLVNPDILLDYLSSGTARIVVFSEFDWTRWRQLGIYDQVEAKLDACYELSFERDNVGQRSEPVYIFTRQDNC